MAERITLGEQTNDQTQIAAALFGMVSDAGAKIRKMGLAAGKIRLGLTYADGSQVSRSFKLSRPLRGDLSLYEQCSMLLDKIFTRRVRIDCRFSGVNFSLWPDGPFLRQPAGREAYGCFGLHTEHVRRKSDQVLGTLGCLNQPATQGY